MAIPRISGPMKTLLSKTLVWSLNDGTFALKVPAKPENKPLRDWLWKESEPMAQYTDARGSVVAWQWRLKLGQHRAVWAKAGKQ